MKILQHNWFVVALLMLGLLTGCDGARPASPSVSSPAAGSPGAPPAARQLKVIASFSILGDLVQHVGGDLIALRTLVQPGVDAHTFEPSPADAVALADADLVFENGLGFEPWLDRLFAASGSQARRVVASAGVAPIETDPHVWHDVGNAMKQVDAIRAALAEADPAHADQYTANATTYLAELKMLDAFVVEQTARLPVERRKLVTSHDTFEYFARRYGYAIVGTALGSVSTESGDPAAGELAALIERIRAAGVPAIFAENVQRPALMEQIAAEAGVVLGPPLYTDALSAPGGDAETYVKMIRYNVTTIVTALGR